MRVRWVMGLLTLGNRVLVDGCLVGLGGWTPLKVAEISLFSLLVSSLSFGFAQAFLGFLVLADGREPLKITNTLDESAPLAATAVVMPVYNEDAQSVFGNLRAVYDSLDKRGELAEYEFFILSDSTDPDKAVEEGMRNRLPILPSM